MIERAIYFTLALALIALAVWPELRTGISDSVLFGVMSTILLVVGLRQLVITPRLADKVSEKMAHASMLRRLWLPCLHLMIPRSRRFSLVDSFLDVGGG